MNIGLSVTRSHNNSRILSNGKFPRVIRPTTQKAFNLATIGGARAVGMSDRIGSLTEGKLADIVIFDATSPAMICAVQHDPLIAVVRHAETREINTVIVGGVVRKAEGKLLDVELEEEEIWATSEQVDALAQGKKLTWGQVSEQLVRSRADIQERIDKSSIDAAEKVVMKMMGVEEGEKVLV